MRNRVIVTDADGCFLSWSQGFRAWMKANGYEMINSAFYSIEERYGISKDEAESLCNAFNESSELSRLPPVNDAIEYIRKLHEEDGYVFHCITAIPNTKKLFEARLENIETLFGKTAFERLTLCDNSENKKKILKEYRDTGCFWIEDLFKNALMGLEVGMKPILIDHHHNSNQNHPEVIRVKSWKEIRDIVTNTPDKQQ